MLSWEAQAFLIETGRAHGRWTPWHFHLAGEGNWVRRASEELTRAHLVEVDPGGCRARITDVGRAWLARQTCRWVRGRCQ
jgi:hypothetical protein